MSETATKKTKTVHVSRFGELEDVTVQQVDFSNALGMNCTVLTYGATVQSVVLPGGCQVAVNQPDLPKLLATECYQGGTCGRFANRIKDGRFQLNGKEFTLATNNGGNHLHGGVQGFDKHVWAIHELVDSPQEVGVVMQRTSPSGEGGYPGRLDVRVRYTLAVDENKLNMRFTATCHEEDTVVNMCNHVYWNLKGEGKILDHGLRLNCSHVLALDETQVPTGERLPVADGPFDFVAKSRLIGARIASVNESSGDNHGYDHCFVADDEIEERVKTVIDSNDVRLPVLAELSSDAAGWSMRVASDQPSVQVYTANWFPVDGNAPFCVHGAVAIETQNFPDAPNHEDFPSALVKVGDTYEVTTVHEFVALSS